MEVRPIYVIFYEIPNFRFNELIVLFCIITIAIIAYLTSLSSTEKI